MFAYIGYLNREFDRAVTKAYRAMRSRAQDQAFALKDTFRRRTLRAERDGVILGGRPLVNYMWISRIKEETTEHGPMCAIRLENVGRAVHNANLYPEADFKLWVDSTLLDDSTRFWLDSFIYDRARHRNIGLCDLQTIPAYARSAVFAPPAQYPEHDCREQPGGVYVRADYARVLILGQGLKDKSRSHVIYSDMDCRDIRLYKAAGIMNRHSVVINDMGPAFPSHGYIGLNARDESIRGHFREWRLQSWQSARHGFLGVLPFEDFLENIGKPFADSRQDIGIRDLLPRITYTIRPDRAMRRIGVN